MHDDGLVLSRPGFGGAKRWRESTFSTSHSLYYDNYADYVLPLGYRQYQRTLLEHTLDGTATGIVSCALPAAGRRGAGGG